LDEVILYVIGHPAWLQKARQGRPTTAKKKRLELPMFLFV
jgi:hypothetical protein